MAEENTTDPTPPDASARSGVGIGVLVVLALLACAIVAILAIRHQRGVVRSNVAKARADMRALAVAACAYYVDCMQLPAMTMTRAQTPDADRYPEGMAVGRTFRMRGTDNLWTITTPVAYVADYPVDPFSGSAVLTYRYYQQRSGHLIGSYGPDRDAMAGGQIEWDLGDILRPDWNDSPPDAAVERIYDSRVWQPSDELLAGAGERGAYTYDPTNGLVSAGDLWREYDGMVE